MRIRRCSGESVTALNPTPPAPLRSSITVPTSKPTQYLLAATIAFATVTTSTLAGGSGWENLISTTDAGVPGVKGAVWVPNQFNNPTIDEQGRVTFRGQIGGAGITTANSRVVLFGSPAAWQILAREGSAVPGNVIPGYVINTTAGINGLASSNNMTAQGGVVVSGNVNGAGVLATTDTATFFVADDGTASLLSREGSPCPGTAGATMSSAITAGSGQQTNNGGRSIFSTALLGGDVSGTTNNAAIVTFSPVGSQLIFRKGSPAPSFTDGTTMTPDTFGLNLSGDQVEIGGTLVNAATVTAANDKARFTSVGAGPGALRMYIREGSEMNGLGGLMVKPTSSISIGNHALMSNGSILLAVDLAGGDTVATLNDKAIVTESNGTFSMLMRRGEAVPGIKGLVFSGPNTSSFVMNNNGMLAYQGLLMNPDGSAAALDASYIGVRKADGTQFVLIRQGMALPGWPGVLAGNLNGSSSICISDGGVVVFSATITGGNALLAWDETNGLRVIAKTGDTNFTGTPATSLTLIGGTGVNGNSGCTGISSTGWLTIRAGDSANAIYTISRFFLGSASTPCPSDLDGTGVVDGADIAILLDGWGTAGGDVDGDGVTDASDIATLLSAWGSCP